MLQNIKSVIPIKRLWNEKNDIVPKSQIKYSDKDYETANMFKSELCKVQERLAESMLAESHRVKDDVVERNSKWKKEVEYRIKDRMDQLKFFCDETIKQKKTLLLEIESMEVNQNRLKNALKIVEGATLITQQCLVFRQGRLGVDLCVDEVENKLLCELKVMKGLKDLLEATIKECNGNVLSLRAAVYEMDEDIKQKEDAINIDRKNLELRESSLKPNDVVDCSRQFCKTSLYEWNEESGRNIEKSSAKIFNATSMRAYVETILKQVQEDLSAVTTDTNSSFKRHIEYIKRVQRKSEEKLNDSARYLNELGRVLEGLELQIGATERSLHLCRMRLNNRTLRSDPELTCDLGQEALLQEQNALQVSLCELKQKIEQNKAVIRYLSHSMILIQEDVNIKANSLKIDEVDCMTIHQMLPICTL